MLGIYTNRLLPHITNRVCGTGELKKYRARVCAGLTGDVLEIGFGSGHNVDFYPEAITSVTAIEPSDVSWKLARERVARSRVPIRHGGLDGRLLDVEDDAFDSALSTFTMCTIPDLPTALAELRRALKPGGTLHFLEHGLAPDESVRRWQYRLDPIEKRLAGGCVFSRPISTLLTDAGFTVTELDTFYAAGPKFSTAFYLGVAVN